MRSLQGRRVLVVEDNWLIATDLVDMLAIAGALPVGPIGRAEVALALASDPTVLLHFAILDVDLHGTPSYRVADALLARGIAFVFTTGFDNEALEAAYRAYPRLQKPVSERVLLQALSRGDTA